MLSVISGALSEGNPVQIGFTYHGENKGHSVLAVGYKKSHDVIEELYCLEPGMDAPRVRRYNEVIELRHRGKNVQYSTAAGSRLVIDKVITFSLNWLH